MSALTPRPKKRFGQCFLSDSLVLERLVGVIAPATDDVLVEIGPGTGVLTDELVRPCRHLYAIELDRELAKRLENRYPTDRFTLIQGDVLATDFNAIANTPEHPAGLRVVGNLPYNISTPLIFHLLKQLSALRDMVFMVQKEVAQRLAATPGDRLYGRLSVMVGARLHCQHQFDVPPGAFTPQPKVHSSVIRLTLRQPALTIPDPQRFADVVRAAFAQRRKTVRNALQSLISADGFAQCGIDPGQRAEQLSVADYLRLAASDAGSRPAIRPAPRKSTIPPPHSEPEP